MAAPPPAAPPPAGKVTTGFCSFTEVTDPAEHRTYNAWHQLDHLPEQLPLPGVHGGDRWVATPECRSARSAAVSELAPVHYLTLYLMGEPIEVTLASFFDLGADLRRAGRFHEHRRARRSGALRVAAARAAPRVLVSAAAVAFRPHAGVWATLEGGADAGGLAAVRDERIAALESVVGVLGVAGAWVLDSVDGPVPGDRSGMGPHVLTVVWCERSPVGLAADLASVLAPIDGEVDDVRTLLAGPFETVTPGDWAWFDDPSGRR